MKRSLLVTALALVAVSAFAESGTWNIDPNHSSVKFTVKHMMVSDVDGRFTKFGGALVGDPADPKNARIDVTVDTNSITTDVEARDNHLRSADFFDVAKYPSMTFVSRRLESGKDKKLHLIGDLTMHGVTRQVVFNVDGPSAIWKDQRGGLHVGARATTTVSRKDFGLAWNKLVEGGGVVVSDDVNITINLEMLKAASAAAAAPVGK